MNLQFDEPVKQHRFTLKCTPVSNNRQSISELHIDVFPKEFLSTYTDSFGNSCIYGYSEKEHRHFSIHVEGIAKTGLMPYEETADEYKCNIYKYHTDYTKPGDNIIATYKNNFEHLSPCSNTDKTVAMMQYLYNHFEYVQGATNIYTSAEEAFSLGKGVCQDYVHIMLSFCRMAGIPSRYVVGMLIGEGLSHAWIEILDHNRWIAFDPTNNLIVDDEHIKFSSGRDYKDCTINQGIFTGNAQQTQQVSVSVKEIY